MDNQPEKNTHDSQLEKNNGNTQDNNNETTPEDYGMVDSYDNANGNQKSNKEAIDDTDKYLAMEQDGVHYTKDTDPTVNSDQMDFNEESHKNMWNSEGGNSLNSDAFNQDDYMLEDNVDLDEDQNQSISSDDEDFEELNERY